MQRFFSLLFALVAMGSSFSATAQKRAASGGAGYQTAVGLRAGGYSSGLTVKHFLSGKNNVAVEALATTEYGARGARLTALLEKHVPISDIKNFQFYYGAGAHLGAYRGRYYFDDARYRRGKKYDTYRVYYTDDRFHPVLGADLILGLEYKIPDLPFVVSIDYKPFFEVFDGVTGLYSDAAFSLRFAF